MTGPADDGVTFRELRGVPELKISERLQKDVWGEDDPADNADHPDQDQTDRADHGFVTVQPLADKPE